MESFKRRRVRGGPHTWFFPLSINRLVTFPKGTPREMTSASETSMGTLRTWRTRDGPQGERSPLNCLLSLPLAEGEERRRWGGEEMGRRGEEGGKHKSCSQVWGILKRDIPLKIQPTNYFPNFFRIV